MTRLNPPDSWFSLTEPIEPMPSGDERRDLADAYRERRAKWGPAWTSPGDVQEYRVLRDAYGPIGDMTDAEIVEVTYAHREAGIRARAEEAAKPTRATRRCAGCRIVITGDEDYTPGCATCADRRKKRRQRGQEVDAG